MNLEVEAARQGAKVLYITTHPREAIDADASQRCDDIQQIRRANGMQEIRYKSGGRIVYVSPNNRGARGHSADVLSIPAGLSAHQMADLMPCLATTSTGRIITRLDHPNEGGGTP